MAVRALRGQWDLEPGPERSFQGLCCTQGGDSLGSFVLFHGLFLFLFSKIILGHIKEYNNFKSNHFVSIPENKMTLTRA